MSDPSRASASTAHAGLAELIAVLRDGTPRSRSELAEASGLGRSTIGLRVDALLESGLIAPVGDATSNGGRPSFRFSINADARLVAAADLGAHHATIALSDLAGTIIASRTEARLLDEDPDTTLEWIVGEVHALFASIGRDRSDLAGLGVGLPGPVDRETGRPVNPPIMPGWNDKDVRGWLTERLGVTVVVDNDVNLMAVGEHAAAWGEVDDLMFVKVATGIGSGIIVDGSLRRGDRGIAGDIGHVPVPRASDAVCRCGNVGCLEAVAAGPAIAAALRELGLDAADGDDVLELLRGGDTDAMRLVRQAGRDIGSVLTTAVHLVNPAVLVIGGSLASAGEHLLAGVRETVYQRSAPLATERLRIATSVAAEQAAVIGAAILVIDDVLSAEGIARFVER